MVKGQGPAIHVFSPYWAKYLLLACCYQEVSGPNLAASVASECRDVHNRTILGEATPFNALRVSTISEALSTRLR